MRWLRPAFQRGAALGEQTALDTGDDADTAADTDAETDATPRAAKASTAWPAGLAGQIKAVADALAEAGASLSLPELAVRFNGKGRWRERLPTILDALVALGRARTQGADRWIDAPQR